MARDECSFRRDLSFQLWHRDMMPDDAGAMDLDMVAFCGHGPRHLMEVTRDTSGDKNTGWTGKLAGKLNINASLIMNMLPPVYYTLDDKRLSDKKRRLARYESMRHEKLFNVRLIRPRSSAELLLTQDEMLAFLQDKYASCDGCKNLNRSAAA